MKSFKEIIKDEILVDNNFDSYKIMTEDISNNDSYWLLKNKPYLSK